jgi:predicted RNase H-like HicB family nuclease
MVGKLTLTAIYEPVGDGWIQARVRELPGVITAGRSREEVEELLVDAALEYLRSFGEAVDADEDAAEDRQPLELTISS